MVRGSHHVVSGVSLLLSGCFSSPPTVADTETGSSTTSGTSVSPTTVAPTSGFIPTSTTETDETSSTSSDTGALSSSSSSGSSSSGAETSADESSSDSSGVVECQGDRVEVDGMCLTPLLVSSAYSVDGVDGGTFDELMPCLTASCGADLPLGGGFETTNIDLYSNEADFDLGLWGICGALIEGEVPNTWEASARCAVAQGDVFTVTEVYALAGDDIGCLHAECPAGTSLVGGGGQWGPDFEMTGSQPTDDGRWAVCGGTFGETPQVEVHAYCAVLAEGASITMSQSTEPVGALSTGCTEAVCSTGIAIAGGGDGGPLATAFPLSRPTEAGEAWMACTNAGPLGGEIRSRVLCYEP